MALVQTATTSFKVQLPQGVHNFGPTSADTFKIALYTAAANINADTATYTTTGEVANGNGYTTGGQALTISVSPTSNGTVAYLSFSNVTWAGATFTARGALIYNATKGNASVAVLDFGSDKTGSGTFVVQFPTADSSSAIIRIS